MTWTTKTSDQFTRANGPLPGTTLDNGLGGTETNTWADGGLTNWQIASNRAYKPTPTGTTIWPSATTVAASQRVSATAYLPAGGNLGLYGMFNTATGAGYLFYNGSSSSVILYNDGAAFSTVQSGGPLLADSDAVVFTCTANSQVVAVNGSTVLTGTNGLLASGVFAMYSESTNGWDDIKYEVDVTATATQLAITTSPVGNQSGVAFTTQPVVAVRDAGNATVTSDTSTVVASITVLTGSVTLGGTTSKAAVAGVATFTNLAPTGTGSYTLTFSDGALTTATTGTLWVGPAAVHITSQATTAYTQRAHGNIVVAVRDGGGTTVTNATNSITIALTVLSGSAVLTSGTTTRSASSGVATFNDLLVTCTDGATWTYAVSSSGLTGDTSSPLTGTVRSLDITDVNT